MKREGLDVDNVDDDDGVLLLSRLGLFNNKLQFYAS